MNVHFKLIHPDVRGQLVSRAEKKIKKLGKLAEGGQYEAQAFMEITKVTGSQHSDAAWSASINVDAHGERFHAESQKATPEKAADSAIRELRAELRTYHSRERRLRRKADGFWKSLLHSDFNTP